MWVNYEYETEFETSETTRISFAYGEGGDPTLLVWGGRRVVAYVPRTRFLTKGDHVLAAADALGLNVVSGKEAQEILSAAGVRRAWTILNKVREFSCGVHPGQRWYCLRDIARAAPRRLCRYCGRRFRGEPSQPFCSDRCEDIAAANTERQKQAPTEAELRDARKALSLVSLQSQLETLCKP
jgi:predicted nucleic acid-binding Zn ribbon protein